MSQMLQFAVNSRQNNISESIMLNNFKNRLHIAGIYISQQFQKIILRVVHYKACRLMTTALTLTKVDKKFNCLHITRILLCFADGRCSQTECNYLSIDKRRNLML